jgi:EAL domain-containing protein (putative c-di-GMP-specific phosphodiesterase class I)
VPVAVNLFPPLVGDISLPGRIFDALARRAVIDLAHALNVTIAEGVENAETAAYLRNCGCGVAQGIYYSPPVAAPAIMELIASPAPR